MLNESFFRKKFELKGKNVLITGATGFLGRWFCAGLAEFGANVALVDLDAAKTKKLAQEISGKYGVKARGFVCDVSDPDAVRRLLKEVSGYFGAIHILLNNAASRSSDLKGFFKPVEDYSLERWREVMSVNLDGMFLVAQAVGGYMAAKKIKGSIIQTGSVYGILAPDNRIYKGSRYLGTRINAPVVYGASKGAVISLTKHLAAHWAAKGIRVNTLTPGGVENGQNTIFKKKYSARVPMGRMATADELVGALVYLASDASSYVTGQNLVVDGGLSAW